MSVIEDLIQSIIDMPGKFFDVIMNGFLPPTQAILILFGAAFVAIPSIALLYLTVGAGFDLLMPGSPGATHPEE
jgi:hypothetical protein